MSAVAAATPPAWAGRASGEDEALVIAREVVGRLEAAWNAADGAAFGAVFAPGAAYVTVRGELLVGGAEIGAGHAGIFASIYAGSVNRMHVVRAALVADGVVVAVSRNTLECPSGPLAGVHSAMSTSVITRQADGGSDWVVVATHNTLVAA